MKKLSPPVEITCCICGKKAPPATPLFAQWCYECLRLYRDAESPTIYTLGHPENQSYVRETNYSAVRRWEEHLKAHGFIKKRGKWRREAEEEVNGKQ